MLRTTQLPDKPLLSETDKTPLASDDDDDDKSTRRDVEMPDYEDDDVDNKTYKNKLKRRLEEDDDEYILGDSSAELIHRGEPIKRQKRKKQTTVEYDTITSLDILQPYNYYTIKVFVSYRTSIKTIPSKTKLGEYVNYFNATLRDKTKGIKARITSNDIDTTFDKIKLGSTCIITNVCIWYDRQGDMMLNIDKTSKIIGCTPDESIHPNYSFKLLSSIEFNPAEQLPIDVIGVVIHSELREYKKEKERTSHVRTVTFVDSSDFSIRVTLWDQQAIDVDCKLGDILTIKSAVCDIHNTFYTLSLTNTSSIEINPDIKERHELHEWYNEKVVKNNDIQFRARLFTSSLEVIDEIEPYRENNPKFVAFENCIIDDIDATAYIGCEICKKSLKTQDNWCQKCNKTTTPATLFKLNVNSLSNDDDNDETEYRLVMYIYNDIAKRFLGPVNDYFKLSPTEQTKRLENIINGKYQIVCSIKESKNQDTEGMEYTAIEIIPIKDV